jgi:hypothetical protein
MNWIIWLVAWAVVGLPIPTIIFRSLRGQSNVRRSEGKFDKYFAMKFLRAIVKYAKLVISLFIGINLLLAGYPDAYMLWAIISFFAVATLFEGIGLGASSRIIAMVVLLSVVLLGVVVVMAAFSGLNNAIYFDQYITKADGFPIENEIPSDMMRLCTKELAESITKQHMSEFGSNVIIADTQITMYGGRLSWVSLIAKQQSWGLTYGISGIVVVDANDPNRTPVIMNNVTFAISDGLDFNPLLGAYGNGIAYGYYSINTANAYGDIYPALTPEGNWVTVLTSYEPDTSFVRRYNGIYVVDQQGKLINHYENDIPTWVVQAYDEQSFFEEGVGAWGGHRRGDGFDFWAGGFLMWGPSNDRLSISEDTRYIWDPDTSQVVAMLMVHPIRESGDFSLAGAFKATPSGIEYYDLSEFDMISGLSAGTIVKSKIVVRQGVEYLTAMELLYPMKVANETKHVWFVPIYFEAQNGLMGLAGLGIVDSQMSEKIYIEYVENSGSGVSLIDRAKAGFRALYGDIVPVTNGTLVEINGTLLAKYEPFTRSGNTMQWISIGGLNGTADVLVNSALVSDLEMLKLQKIELGGQISVLVNNASVVHMIR